MGGNNDLQGHIAGLADLEKQLSEVSFDTGNTASSERKEFRFRIGRPEDRQLVNVFEEVCRDTQRTPRAVVLHLLDIWTRKEGGALYGDEEIARKLEGE